MADGSRVARQLVRELAKSAEFHHGPEGNVVVVRNLRVFRLRGSDVDV
jgi:hypothetical protein